MTWFLHGNNYTETPDQVHFSLNQAGAVWNHSQLVKMIFYHICVTFFGLVLFTQVRPLRSQAFLDHDEQARGKIGGNVSLIWNFFIGGFSFQRIRFIKEPGTVIMSVLPGIPTLPGAGFEDTVEYIEPYGVNISNLTFSDSALYTCEIILNNSGVYKHATVLTVYQYPEPIELLMSVEGENGELNTGDTVASGESLKVTVQAPENEPAAIDISIQILYDGQIDETEKCENRSVASPCIFSYRVLAGKVGQNLTIEACLTHPAISSTSCSNISLSIKEIDPQEDKCKWWCILIIVLVVVSVVVIIIIICCCWHYKVACFAHRCCPWSSNHSSKVDVNDVERTVTTGSHGNKQDAGNKDSPYRDVHRPDGHMPQKGDGSHGLQVPQGVPVTNSDQKRPMPSPGRKTVLPPLEDPERSKKKKKKNRKSREEE